MSDMKCPCCQHPKHHYANCDANRYAMTGDLTYFPYERMPFLIKRLEAELARHREALAVAKAKLELIHNRDDEEMKVAKTLHYDMRGWAGAALAEIDKLLNRGKSNDGN